jgi:hypothetical protein
MDDVRARHAPLSSLRTGTENKVGGKHFASGVLGASAAAVLAVGASVADGQETLTWVPGSSVKLEQVIGDCDWQRYDWADKSGTCLPTTSQTVSRFNILGNGFGCCFEDNGKVIFLFGDTISQDPATVNYHAADPLAWSTSTQPEAGLLLTFYTQSDGTPLFIKPPGIKIP